MIDVNKIKEEFQKIKELDYVESVRPLSAKNDGALGNTFEKLLGVVENNLTTSDFKGWECKSQRSFSKSASSLFTIKPDHPEKGDTYMRNAWGVPDPSQEYPHIKVFRTSIYANRWSTVYDKYKMKLVVDRKNAVLKILLCDLQHKVIDENVYWKFSSLEKASAKLKNTFVVKADEKQINGKVCFKFVSGKAYIGFKFKNLLKLIENGCARYDNRLGIYRTGKYIGKEHNHGGGIRLINSSCYEQLFEETINL